MRAHIRAAEAVGVVGKIEAEVDVPVFVLCGAVGEFVIVSAEPEIRRDGFIPIRDAGAFRIHQVRQLRTLHHENIALVAMNEAQRLLKAAGVELPLTAGERPDIPAARADH